MVRNSVLAMFAALAIVLGGVVVSTPVGAVVDAAVVVPSPNIGGNDNYLNAVSCVSASDCVAVGATYNGSGDETLVMVWDGVEWLIVSSPNAASDDELYSVSCVSASDCVAVGVTYTDSGSETLVMVWNGAEWLIVSSPNASSNEDRLWAVSCVSVSDCVAVGYTYTGSADETLVVSLTGPVPPSTTTTAVVSDLVVPAYTG